MQWNTAYFTAMGKLALMAGNLITIKSDDLMTHIEGIALIREICSIFEMEPDSTLLEMEKLAKKGILAQAITDIRVTSEPLAQPDPDTQPRAVTRSIKGEKPAKRKNDLPKE